MLEAAVAMVNRTGLTVSLDHISFEEVIRDAGVSRSTAYRRWPYKDLFFSDLLKELAEAATPASVASEAAALPEISEIVLERLDWLGRPELRHDLVLELIRRAALREFETMRVSTEWRTYLALHTTFLSVADEALQADLQSALARSERSFIGRVAAGWERMAALLGYRLRPDMGATLETFATLASAHLRGLIVMALAVPDIGTQRVLARPLGATQPAEWSVPALGLASIAMTFLEPDPTVDWDGERIQAVRRAVELLTAAS